MTDQDLTEPLEKLRSMLAPDGYDLVVAAQREGVVDLEVVAGAEACSDCLVPKEVFAQVVAQYLGPSGLQLGELAYPAESTHEGA